jgi:hypothetical protein
MSSSPKIIQIFLPRGEPHGIRVAEITTPIVQVIEVFRSLLASFLAMEQSSQVGVYFLIGEAPAVRDPLVYVGQTGELCAVLISRANSLAKTHALFLLWYSLQAVRKAIVRQLHLFGCLGMAALALPHESRCDPWPTTPAPRHQCR